MPTSSVAASVRAALAQRPSRCFVHASELPGPLGAVEAELARLARRGHLRRVRKGLYWQGPRTALGIAAPDPETVALEVAGRGAGPAGIAAAQWLGLTTQVAGQPTIAVPGRVPTAVPGVRFCARSSRRRELDLDPTEVAVVEVLRDWPMSVEASWDDLTSTIATLTATHAIRPDIVAADIAFERHPKLRERWAALQHTLDAPR